ncbi:MAG: SDR family NAD(P)-dependent oxidoreductase, partial [Myxococcota bacterium]
MNVAFLGATSGMGRALSRAMASRGDRLFLLGRSEETLREAAKDLEVRGAAGAVSWALCDLAKAEGFEVALDKAEDALGQI